MAAPVAAAAAEAEEEQVAAVKNNKKASQFKGRSKQRPPSWGSGQDLLLLS
jgi:hypothetical protein